MKILYITYDGINDAIGQSQIVPYINGLLAHGLDFTILSFEKKVNLNSATKMLDSRACWKRLRYNKNPPVISSCYDILKGLIAGISLLSKKKIPVIHARGYVSAMIGFLLKRIFRIKFIFDMRGMWAEEKVDAGIWKKSDLLYKTTKYLENIFFYNADTIIVLTDSAKKLVSQNPYAGNKQIEKIPTCVDIKKFLTTSSNFSKEYLGLNGKFIILYLGSLGTFYAFEEMVDFFSTILKNNYVHNPYFLIVTNNPSSAIHQSMQLKNLSVDNYGVRQMSHAQVKDILPIADISLMFYKRILSKAGCCPTKFGESLACGLPVVINAGIGDTENIVRKEKIGVIVEEFSPEAYKKAIEQLLSLLSARDALRQRCRQASLRYFSLDSGIDRYQKIYQDLLQPSI